MADKEQRTEKPTPKRRHEARREGRVARSADVSSWLSFLGVLLVLPSLGARAGRAIGNLMALATQAMASPDNGKAVQLLGAGLATVLDVVWPVTAVAVLIGIGANLAQVGFHLAPGALGFKLSKISPRAGFRRIVSPTGAWDLAKNLARLALLGGVGYAAARSLVNALLGPGTLPLAASLQIAASGVSGLAERVGVVALLFGVADYAFQRRQFGASLRMTRDELRRELRESEGNPEIRRAIRQRRRNLTRMQMIAAVANADVVVINPTHYAVGLSYDRARHRAPRLLAKGEDDIAAAIRAAAQARGVPVVESPPLARAVYASCEVGDEVPPALYEVVAKLFAFVYRLSPTARALVDVHHLHSTVPAGVT